MFTANTSTRSITTVTKSVYDDFSVPTPCRYSRLIVDGHVMYVNAGWLAEVSPFFANVFFGDHASNELELSSDVTYEEVLELMRIVFYCPTRKPITAANVATVMRLASHFKMKPVVERCQEIIARRVETLDMTRLCEVTRVVAQCERNSPAMALIVDKLSKMSEEELSRLQFSQVPGDVVADVFAAKMKRSRIRPVNCCFL